LLSCHRASEELGESFKGDAGSPGRLRRSDEAQGELKNLETAALHVCRELEGAEGQSSGRSLASRLRSPGRLVTERLRGALRLGV
jgi:hypothetical protein